MNKRSFAFVLLGVLISVHYLVPSIVFAQITSIRLSPEVTETSPTSAAPTLRTIDSASDLTTKPILIDKDVLKKIESIKKDDAPKTNEIHWGILIQNLFSEYWVQFLALVVSVIGVVLAVSGFSLANKKKHKYLKRFLHDIDNAYSSYKMKSKRCEAEMIRLQDQIEDKLKEGALDEGSYHLLENRINKYLEEIKTENGGKPLL